jgi:hypothetical protein
MGAVSSLASAVGDVVGGAVDTVGSAVGAVGDVVHDAGSAINSAVKDVIPGGWATVAAVTAAILTDGASLGADSTIGAEELAAANATADPIAALNASQGWTAADTGYLADIGATQGLLSTAEANNAALANATPEPLPQSSVPAEQIAAANETSDPIAALNGQQGWTKADIPYLESIGASPEIIAAANANNAALASSISPLTAVRGLGLVNSLLGGTQTPQQAGGGQQAYNTGGERTGVDYSQLMGLLSQQPMRRNVSSLLG